MLHKDIEKAIVILKTLDRYGQRSRAQLEEAANLGKTRVDFLTAALKRAKLIKTKSAVGYFPAKELDQITLQKLCNVFEVPCKHYKLGRIKLSDI